MDELFYDRSIEKYKKIATLNKDSSSKVNVFIAKLLGSDEQRYIVNRFEHNKENQGVFKDLFFLIHSEKKHDDIVDLLTDDKYFYIIFKYYHAPSVTECFCEEKNTSDYDQRCMILNKILLSVSAIDDFPYPALACTTELRNICINKDNDVLFSYNFENYHSYVGIGSAGVFDNMSDLLSLLLAKELKDSKISFLGFYNKPYKVILQKCETRLYANIPEFIVDVKKAEKVCDVKDSKSTAKQMVDKKKKKIKKYASIAMILVIVGVIASLFAPFFVNKNVPNSAVTSIGGVTYNKSATSDEQMDLVSDEKESSSPIDFTKISIPANTDILYEEYIVQYGETLKQICESYYGNANLVNAVMSFNSIKDPDKLNAGAIVKLPSGSVIDKFAESMLAESSRLAASISSDSSSSSGSTSSGLSFIF